jgi:hypothetical protein
MEMSFPHIRVWRIQDVPAELKRFCPAGWLNTDGNSTVTAVWFAHVPAKSGWVGWLQGREFECCEAFEHKLDDGSYIAIGGHHQWCERNGAPDLPVDNDRVIRVWRYGDERADVTVPNTDDADWVAQVPRDFVGAEIAWLANGSNFGCSGVDVHKLPDGSEMHIGCHS